MTRFTQLFTAAGLVCLGAFVGTSARPAAQAQVPAAVKPALQPQRWEYKLVHDDPKEQELNALGAEGWELVIYGRGTSFHQVYKRPKP